MAKRTAKRSGKSKEKSEKSFNPRSPDQVISFLRSQGVRLEDTEEPTLARHAADHPLIPLLLELRSLDKLNSTYCAWDMESDSQDMTKSYNKWIDENGLIHSDISVQGAETGRCNSRNPNIQNVVPSVRHCFVSRYDGGWLICVDESSLEYRLIAHESRDKRLLEIFNNNRDIHKEAAKWVFGYPDNMTKAQRKEGKTLNYAAVYGAGEEKVYTLIGRRDRKVYDKIRSLYPDVGRWKEHVIRLLNVTKRIRNMFGRTREFRFIDDRAEREAINWMIQSAGHDILKIHLMEILHAMKENGIVRTLLVHDGHDSGIFDSPPEEVEKAKEIIEEVSSDLNSLIFYKFGVKMAVPIVSDISVQKQWD